VYDYSIGPPQGRTRDTNVGELLETFSSERTNPRALNFLDIENRTGIQFCPSAITRSNILQRLEAGRDQSKGKTDSMWEPHNEREFFLISTKDSFSSIHVDTAGKTTWLLSLTGSKVIYFLRRSTPAAVRWLSQAGSQVAEGYPSGWCKVLLKPGDLL
jgi:hypothetical protein